MTPVSSPSATETLSRLSQLAGQQFETVTDATQAVLETITGVLSMSTSWVSRVDNERCQLGIVAAHNESGIGPMRAGLAAPLEITFCNLILSMNRPQPLIIEDVRNSPTYSECTAAKTFPTVGSYVGVPIILSDGTVHGTLCASDPAPVRVTLQQAELLSVLSRLLATQIERDQELAARTRAETRFEAFMDHTPAIAYMKSQDGRYVYANLPWHQTFEYETGWIVGKTDYDFLDADTAVAVRDRDEQVLQANDVQHFHEMSLGPDGEARHWHSIKFPVIGGDEDILLGGISVDVTDSYEKDMQRALLAAIVNDTQDAVYAKTLDGVILAWNPSAERLYGYSAEEMIGNTLDALIPPGMKNELPELDRRLHFGERIAQHETWRRAKDGRLLNVELTLSLIRDAEGVVAGISIIARDITEHMRLIAERDRLYTELQGEVARAAEIQSHLLPTTVPWMPGFEFAAACWPAREVGGDFYDWAETTEGTRITLGDVTGKGMAAALLMATARAALRGAANEPVNEAVTTVNRALMGDLGHSDAFVTMFHADLCPDGSLTYTDAGHGLALVVRRNGCVEQLVGRQLPIGIVDTQYTSTTIHLDVGDVLIVYSDGLPDSRPDLELENPVNFASLCAPCVDVNQILESLQHASERNGPRPDDLTIIAVRRHEPSE